MDARFEDGGEAPIHLKAFEAEGLGVISSLCQDAVFPAHEMQWQAAQRRFAILLNRYRWEYTGGPERVQSVLVFEDVLAVQSQGIERGDASVVLSLLAVEFTPGDDGMGRVELTLAGDGAIALQVEALEATLRDVTKPYAAPSGRAPEHGV